MYDHADVFKFANSYTSALNANVQTQGEHRVTSGQPSLNSQSSAQCQKQSHCDSITNEGQITGRKGWQRRKGGKECIEKDLE